MKKWAFVTIVLYAIFLFVFSWPVGLLCGGGSLVADFYSAWWGWVIFSFFVLAQVILLVFPVKSQWPDKLKKHHVLFPIIIGAFFMGVLLAGIITSVLVVIFGDDAGLTWNFLIGLSLVILSWIFWFFRFKEFAKNSENPRSLMGGITKRLFRGSLAELLVAVPSHILVRWRGDCSAPYASFIAIAVGFAVLLLSFGPGVFYLFAARKERMMPRRQQTL